MSLGAQKLSNIKLCVTGKRETVPDGLAYLMKALTPPESKQTILKVKIAFLTFSSPDKCHLSHVTSRSLVFNAH